MNYLKKLNANKLFGLDLNRLRLFDVNSLCLNKRLLTTCASSSTRNSNSSSSSANTSSSTGSGSSSSKTNSSTSIVNNSLTVNKSRRLMRAVYARVHPDLFTNHLHAQKQNENSLKILRNLFDSYSSSVTNRSQLQSSNRFMNSNNVSQNELLFYLKDPNSDSQLKKIKINLSQVTSSSSPYSFNLNDSYGLQTKLENVLNQFIDHLKLPMNKFNSSNMFPTSSSSSSSRFNKTIFSNLRYSVSYNKMDYKFGYDDEYIDFEEYERWSNQAMNENKIPNINDWLKENKSKIEMKQKEGKLIEAQLEKNKSSLIQKWKLKNIIIQSNWSLKHFNSYLQALNNLNPSNETHFKGFTLVLTNDNRSGLHKNGHIHLNVAQVYEEWLNILARSLKNANLLDEIRQMESYLSQLLRQIKICDILDDSSSSNVEVDQSLMSSASNYTRTLNTILNNLTSKLNLDKETECLLKKSDFSHLQLAIQDGNNLYLNQAGQFVIGKSSRINFESTIAFIERNQNKAVELYRDHIKSQEKLISIQQRIESKMNSKKLVFDHSLNYEKKEKCLNNLMTKLNGDSLKTLDQTEIKIGTCYQLNDNGSIQIPWNFYDY